jgi:transaldolase
MTSPRLLELSLLGQSTWIDFLSRDLIANGGLHRLIDAGVSGVTTNPTILAHAVTGTTAYDQQINELVREGLGPDEALLELAETDVRAACDALADVWRASRGRDGFISWEVNPALAYRSDATLEEARFLAQRTARPNLLVKIPATLDGVAAFEEATAIGLSVNVTLIFSVERYREIVAAYLRGLARARDAGVDLTTIHSVASLFVSRLDTAADAALDRIGTPRAAALRGRLGIASAKLAYRAFQQSQQTKQWEGLSALGANPQRCLWASTGMKNAAYRDVMYVEELIGPETVTTLPEPTLDAFLDHGRVAPTLVADVDDAAQHVRELETVGVDVAALATELERDGVRRFRRSQSDAVDAIWLSIARAA